MNTNIMNKHKDNIRRSYVFGRRTIFRLNPIRVLVFILVTCLPLSANAIQILENINLRTGQSTLTVGITSAQLSLGPIDGFFVNLLVFPFIGPSPEIISFEFDLAGAAAINPNGQNATWDFNDTITDPTEIFATLLVDFDPSIPIGTVATYELSSMDSNGQVLETLIFESKVFAVPVTATIWLFGSGLIGLIGMRKSHHKVLTFST